MGHMRGPTGERPCVCSVCGRSFSFEEYMKAHMRIHTEEKLFLCRICRKEFGQRGALKTHMKIHTAGSTYQSVICDKKLYKPDALKIHMRSHTGEKLYLCNVCGKSFTYQTHGCPQRRTDTSRGKTFLRKDELKRHLITHRHESIQLMAIQSIKVFKAEIRYYLLIQTVRLHQSGLTVRFHLSIKANMHSFRD